MILLAAWTEILPLFVVRWLARRYCERISIDSKTRKQCLATARPDVLVVMRAAVGESGVRRLTDAEVMARKPIGADFVSFRAGVRSIELDLGIYE